MSTTATAPAVAFATAATSTTVTTIAASQTSVWRIKGTISINAGGSIRPDIIFGTAPGVAPTIAIGSYFRIYPIGPAGQIAVGTWS